MLGVVFLTLETSFLSPSRIARISSGKQFSLGLTVLVSPVLFARHWVLGMKMPQAGKHVRYGFRRKWFQHAAAILECV